jgi:hypothetical protein
MKDLPAYKDQQLENRPGEQWKDIPGLEGYFMISDHGRVRRLEYKMEYRNGAIYIKPEKIIKPQIARAPNRYKKDFQQFLTSRVTLSGRRHNFTVNRLVYYCFVRRFNMEDPNRVILCKDKDNFNVQPGNLILATLSEKQTRTVKDGRFRSPFTDLHLSETFRKKQRAAIAKKVSKQVTQYTRKGRKLKTFSSMAAAQRATGIFASSIGSSASGKIITAGGFVWRWGNAPSVDITGFREARRKQLREKHGQKVTQYDLAGNIIAHYPSLLDAEAATGAGESAIRFVLKGEYKSAKGFFWKKGYGRTVLDLSSHLSGNAAKARSHQKKVKQYTLEGRYVRSFDSLKEAAAYAGVISATMSDCCRGRQSTCKGYIWKFA